MSICIMVVSFNVYALYCCCHACSLFLGATAAAPAAAAVADQTTRRPTGRGGTHATHTRRLSSSRAAIQYRQSLGHGRFFARASYPIAVAAVFVTTCPHASVDGGTLVPLA